jgi:hypothetical protein
MFMSVMQAGARAALGWRRWLPRWLDACVAGAPTLAFAKRPAYSSTSMHTSAAVYGWSCGVSGAPVAIATGRYAVAGYLSFAQRWRLGRRRDCGKCLVIRRFSRPSATLTSIQSDSLVLRPLQVLKFIEPPW